MNQKEYEEDLKRRQQQHLDNVKQQQVLNEQLSYFKMATPWKPCLHDGCTECVGTGIKANGTSCIHYISCQCPKCSPFFGTTQVTRD